MRRLRNVLIAVFLAGFVILLGYFNVTKPRILVLHSAARDSVWATQMDRGMREALQRNRRPLSVEWMYLAVSAPASTRSTAEAQAEARRAIDRIRPDVLIAVDDEANALVARDYVGADEPRILYVSIDRPPADYGYTQAQNVSGIADTFPLPAVRDAVTDFFPGRPTTLAVLGVDNDSGRAELARVRAFDWGPIRLGDTGLVSTAAAWRDAVTRSAGADVLLVLSTQDLPEENGTVASAAEISRWTEANAGPLPIGTEVDFVQDGGGLSFAPPPEAYGEQAIGLALDWLDARRTPGPPPLVESSHFEVAVRQSALARRGIVVAPIYVEAARENNALFD